MIRGGELACRSGAWAITASETAANLAGPSSPVVLVRPALELLNCNPLVVCRIKGNSGHASDGGPAARSGELAGWLN